MMPMMYELSFWLKGNEQRCIEVVEHAITQSGHTVLKKQTHVFEPQGFTALWLLAESHCAIHTYPEHDGAYVQLSSCSQEKYAAFKQYMATLPLVNLREHVSDLLNPVEN